MRVCRHPFTLLTPSVHEMDRRPIRFSAHSLVHILVLPLIGLLLAGPAAAKPDPARQIKQQEHALVRSLEAIYAKSMDVARSGDIDAYWRWRTAAARERPPYLDKSRLPLFAGMLPALQTLQFVRMDTTAQMARSLYKWPREDMARYTVVVYRIEDGEDRFDHGAHRRCVQPAGAAARPEAASPQSRLSSGTLNQSRAASLQRPLNSYSLFAANASCCVHAYFSGAAAGSTMSG